MKDLVKLSFTSNNAKVSVTKDGIIKLYAKREPIGEKFFPSHEAYRFRTKESVELEEYFVIKYSCFGIKRPDAIKPAIIWASKAGEKTPLIIFDDITIDNKTHSVIAKIPAGSYDGIFIEYSIDKVLSAHFSIHSMYTCSKAALPSAHEGETAEKKDGFFSIDLSDMFDAEYDFDSLDSVTDSGVFFDRKDISLYGVPFIVKPEGNNIITPPPSPSENDDSIINFGASTKRRYCRPVSRDSETVISINKAASELYFILTLSGKRHIRCLYGTNGEVLGGEYIDLYEPLKIRDTEFFMAEVVYKDGHRDTHLPLNLATFRHGISGDIGVYAIPCDETEIESLIIHNRMLDTDVCLAAVTANLSGTRLYPGMLIPEKKSYAVTNVAKDKGFYVDGSILTVYNGAVGMKIDLSRSMRLIEMSNAYIPDMKVSQGSMLKLRDEYGNIYEDFSFSNIQYHESFAKILYSYDGIMFDILCDISGKNDIKWQLNITNLTEKEFKKGIIFPHISGIDFGSFEDNWYFVPKYQNLCSNETFYMYEESAPSFPMQFMDVFSPERHGGICLSTQETGLITRKYSLSKNEGGLEMYVEYPIIYGDIAAREERLLSPTVITCHDGGWTNAFKIYKSWLDTWFTPYKCQDKLWYRKCFWLLAEITDFFETSEIAKFPCWYTPETGEFNFRKILDEQKSITGVYPDILHMWSWCNTFRNGEYGQIWGNYGKEDYEKYGGVDAFRKALHDIRDNLGVQISLYMHPTLLTETYAHSEKFYPTSTVISESGKTIGIYGDTTRMCHAEEGWREHALSMYPRIYKELGIPLLYVDEFSLRIENRCYADNHGHRVPSSLLKTDRDFISRLKEIMPEEVVLYGEYAAVDVNARYIDCNISYYILDSIVDMIETAKAAGDGDDTFSKVYTNAYRFAFPKLVQLILPMAMRNISWHPQKFMFFNAEAIYDSFWDCEESRGLDFTVKAYKLKKKYADCFTSDYPEMMIETESPAICMNKFPSKDRIVYTVYNRAYSTFRGKALRVPYTEGAQYYDAWNEKELEYKVKNGFAEIYLEIGAQEMGCIVIE